MFRRRLEALYDRYHTAETLTPAAFGADVRPDRVDPLVFPRRYDDPADQEAVALLASGLAFGRVETIYRSVQQVLDRIHGAGLAPGALLREFDRRRHGGIFSGLRHRWVTGDDLEWWMGRLGGVARRYGGLEAAFVAQDCETDPTIRTALAGWLGEVRGAGPVSRGARYLVPDARGGSACKRMNLFLRWVVRPADGLDLGLWQRVDPARLVIPVDTHVARIARFLGFTARSTVSWAMAEEITAHLARYDSRDPVRFDYAICRLGILGDCPSRRDPIQCEGCSLLDHCRAGE